MDKSSKVMVTGANGLLGSYVLRYLVKNGYTDILALVRPHCRKELWPKEIIDKFEIKEADFMDYDVMDELTKEVDYIIHVAAEVNFNDRNDKHLFQINIDGTEQIVDLCLSNNVKKLIYVSSTAALGRLYDNQVLDEKTMWETSKLNTQYAVSKHYGEREVWRGHEEGLNVGIVNPALIVSPGFFNKSSAGIFSRIYKKLNHYPTGTNGMVDVRDAAQIILHVLESDINSIKVIACAENISYRDLFSQIAMNFGKNIPSIAIKSYHRFLIQTLYKIKSIFGQNVDISKSSLLNSSMNFYYNNQRSIDLFDYKYIKSKETLKTSCQYYTEAKLRNEDFCILPI